MPSKRSVAGPNRGLLPKRPSTKRIEAVEFKSHKDSAVTVVTLARNKKQDQQRRSDEDRLLDKFLSDGNRRPFTPEHIRRLKDDRRAYIARRRAELDAASAPTNITPPAQPILSPPPPPPIDLTPRGTTLRALWTTPEFREKMKLKFAKQPRDAKGKIVPKPRSAPLSSDALARLKAIGAAQATFLRAQQPAPPVFKPAAYTDAELAIRERHVQTRAAARTTFLDFVAAKLGTTNWVLVENEKHLPRILRKRGSDVRIVRPAEYAKLKLEWQDACPGHVASPLDVKICDRCGIHIDELRPTDD